LVIAERILNEASKCAASLTFFTNDTSGVLTIATTHTQARYSLPTVIKSFRALFPEVRLELIQGTPQEIETLLHNGGADIGIASERLSNDSTLAAFPWFRWHHSLLVLKDHPLLQTSPLTLEEISRWPLITYRQGITGRSRIDEAFGRKGLLPDIVLSAQDSDVIKPTLSWGWGSGWWPSSRAGRTKRANWCAWTRVICSMPIPSGLALNVVNCSATMSGALSNSVMQDCRLRISNVR
jgi:LysR family cys regulon transcriptional activator